MRELVLRKCPSCGALVKVITDCSCSCKISCCEKPMVDIKPNSVDAAFEKHVPVFEIVNDKIKVVVNHVMEEDHFIEWICFVTETSEHYIYFKPGENAITTFPYTKGILYAYCNKHGLWSKEVD